MNKKLSHLNTQGQAHMVDISQKEISARVAIATSNLQMQRATLDLILQGNMKKGDVIGTARIAGIMAAKNCSNLIPLCHPLAVNSVEIEITPDFELVGFNIKATVKVQGKTGVEMEALVAASITALTLYDMAKAAQKDMIIGETKLIHKAKT